MFENDFLIPHIHKYADIQRSLDQAYKISTCKRMEYKLELLEYTNNNEPSQSLFLRTLLPVSRFPSLLFAP